MQFIIPCFFRKTASFSQQLNFVKYPLENKYIKAMSCQMTFSANPDIEGIGVIHPNATKLIMGYRFAFRFTSKLLPGLVTFLPGDVSDISESTFVASFATVFALNLAA